MLAWCITLAAALINTGTGLASPPIPSDIALSMNVVSEASSPYPTGSVGTLELTVTRLAGSPPGFSIDTTDTLLPLNALAPIRFEPADAGDPCNLQEVTDRPFVEGRYWFLLGNFGTDGQTTCRITFEVLPPAAGNLVPLRFRARAHSGLSAGYIDINPDDNVADLLIGTRGAAPRPVPGPDPLRWLLVAVLLLAAGQRELSSRLSALRREK